MNPTQRIVFVFSVLVHQQTNAFSIGEVSSHLTPLLSSHQTANILSHGPASLPSLLSSTAALVPTLSPQQAALAMYNDYRTLLAIHPLPTKLVTGAVLALTGDAVAQGRDQNDSYNASRGVCFAMFDMTYRAVQHYLFPVIVDVCRGQFFLSIVQAMGVAQALGNIEILTALERSLANQLIVVPFFYYPVFFTFTGVMQGLTFNEGLDRAKQNFLPLMKRNLLFWIPIQYAQFAFVPFDLQIPFLCVAGLVWTYILSILAGSTKKYANETPESDETYCVIGNEDECILPEGELLPVPAMFSKEESLMLPEEEMLPEPVMAENFGEVGVPASTNSTGEEILVKI